MCGCNFFTGRSLALLLFCFIFTEDIRVYAAMSFAFLLIIVGVPLWWKTTEVYRVHVPYGRIDDLKELDVSFPISVTILSKNINRAESVKAYLEKNTSSSTGNSK